MTRFVIYDVSGPTGAWNNADTTSGKRHPKQKVALAIRINKLLSNPKPNIIAKTW
jgi:hypothetical protein